MKKKEKEIDELKDDNEHLVNEY